MEGCTSVGTMLGGKLGIEDRLGGSCEGIRLGRLESVGSGDFVGKRLRDG